MVHRQSRRGAAFEFNDEVASHALINSDDMFACAPQGKRWPAAKVKRILKRG
jgi:hypothetical protein